MAPSVDINTAPQLVLIIVPTIALTFTTIAVALRFYSRTLSRVKYGLDDWLALASLPFAYGLHIALCIGVAYGGLGVSAQYLQPSNMVIYLKVLITSGAIYGTAVTLLQLSILSFYLRLFKVSRWHNICCHIVMGICVAWWIAFFGGTMGDCVPLDKLWNPMLAGKCVDQNKACGSTGIAHIIIDLIILSLPMPVIWQLRMAKARKLQISFIFALGLFATVCSILRISCIVGLVKINHADFTLSSWMSFLFEMLEVATGIICVCLPSLPAVYTKAVSSPFGSYTKRLLSSLLFKSQSQTLGSDPHPSQEGYFGKASNNSSSGKHSMNLKSDSHIAITSHIAVSSESARSNDRTSDISMDQYPSRTRGGM
ncbi:uncharacterized protein EAE98_002475 [Botrytis deweyae]|uniref:Rhodopsin domain-containing protein n=1 Tax=Botrytis deweyae TaxID=2478750 RepID=A0ABQ7IXD1_9HELO|nr:uncharacterized protein EAE98_002475 [Botrytis deweyae]KAF7936256.1 hypothetical protein EAE98_002475 [Botrytis deweyae]